MELIWKLWTFSDLLCVLKIEQLDTEKAQKLQNETPQL